MRTCTFDGCQRELRAKGLCATHYRQQHNGKPLKPIRSRPTPPEGYAYCTRCKNFKPRDEFYSTVTGAPRYMCKPCTVEVTYQRALERKKANV